MTNEQKKMREAISYMIYNADRCDKPNCKPIELVFEILIRIMPLQIIEEAMQEATKKATPTDESKDCQ